MFIKGHNSAIVGRKSESFIHTLGIINRNLGQTLAEIFDKDRIVGPACIAGLLRDKLAFSARLTPSKSAGRARYGCQRVKYFTLSPSHVEQVFCFFLWFVFQLLA